MVSLDELEPLQVAVGYGFLGRRGELGYDGATVRVGGRAFASALSTHPPARVRFAVPNGCRRFRSHVAINDDAVGTATDATFTVLADGCIVAEVGPVCAGDALVPLEANIDGAGTVDLVASTSSWPFSHAVWIEPTFDDGIVAASNGPRVVVDPLRRAEISVPVGLQAVRQCIATVASAGFEVWLEDMLASLRANGGCPDALIAIFALDESSSIRDLADRFGAVTVPCRPLRPLDPTAKAVMYSVASVIPAERFLCLDADMLVLADLRPLFDAFDVCPARTMFVCGEGNDHGIPDLASALDMAYGGGPDPSFFARNGPFGHSRLVVNDGLLAGSRHALAEFERRVGQLPGAVEWVDERGDIRWRNQFVANVALAHMESVVELDPAWNLQLHAQHVDVDGGRATWRGRDVARASLQRSGQVPARRLS